MFKEYIVAHKKINYYFCLVLSYPILTWGMNKRENTSLDKGKLEKFNDRQVGMFL